MVGQALVKKVQGYEGAVLAGGYWNRLAQEEPAVWSRVQVASCGQLVKHSRDPSIRYQKISVVV